MKNWARQRAAKLSIEKRRKAVCCVCGDFIYNRMMFKEYSLNFKGEKKSEYAHTVCSRKDQDDHIKNNEFMGYVWERCW